MTPDLICLQNFETGQPITTEQIRASAFAFWFLGYHVTRNGEQSMDSNSLGPSTLGMIMNIHPLKILIRLRKFNYAHNCYAEICFC